MKIVDFVGYSGSGKTTLLEQLIKIFTDASLNVASVKNTHHDFDVDKPGKDSFRFRQAGARQVIVRNDDRWAMMVETPAKPAGIEDLLAKLSPCDLVIVEGFKSEENAFLRLEVWREGVKPVPPIFTRDPHIQAVVTDCESIEGCRLPLLDINNPKEVADWIINKLELNTRIK